MKKIILLITIILILTGCNTNKNNNLNNQEISNNNQEQHNNETNTENKDLNIDTYKDENPVKVALYENNKIVKSYNTKISNNKDIAVFDVYYTNDEETTEKNTKSNFLKYYNMYENISNIKTGFYFEFEAENKKIEHLVLDPTSEYALDPYFYIYLYDDINQEPYTYYSHLTKEEMNDSTIISSIKIYSAEAENKITSPITLNVFTYDSLDDITEDNHYRGNSSYTITINPL